jgi:hypothetical protein
MEKDRIEEWLEYPEGTFVSMLVNELRGEILKAQMAAEEIDIAQALKTTLPNGKEIDLVAIIISSSARANHLLDVGSRYAEARRK